MAKESKRKLKTKALSSPKYVSSDDDDSNDNTPFPNGINEKGIIKRPEKELVARENFLRIKRICLSKKEKVYVSSTNS
jgi:hypothetical protein